LFERVSLLHAYQHAQHLIVAINLMLASIRTEATPRKRSRLVSRSLRDGQRRWPMQAAGSRIQL
jgi:hypothetical protein